MTDHADPPEAPDQADPADLTEALTIAEFCHAYRYSPSLYFKEKRAGRGPRELKVGRRVVITKQAAAEWARQHEAGGS
jgi:hypothetical protein